MMVLIFTILIFLMGASIGSFLPVVFYRKKHHIPLTFTSRSACDYCGKQLDFVALIPVFSYFLLKGKSRCCQRPLPIRYPIFEFLSGMIFVILFFLILY